MDRRTFHRLCGGLLGGAATLHRSLAAADDDADDAPGDNPGDNPGTGTAPDVAARVPNSPPTAPWPRTRLLAEDERPLTLAALAPGEARVFHYPYRVTPCFLVRLSADPEGAGGWPGGLGPDGTVVAFSAICSHKMSHPARPISHIAYRAEPVEFSAPDGTRRSRAGTISCCSERSVYDPADGARVLAGPAPVPLAAIALAPGEDDSIVATGSLGQDRYEAFLDTFGFRLALEHGSSDVRRRSGDTAIATLAENFSRQQIRC